MQDMYQLLTKPMTSTSLISKATGLSSPNRMTDFSRNVTGISSCRQPVDSSSAVSIFANTSSATSFLIWKKTLLGRLSRSEEHTSELQSRLHLVCRLLLEKKKKINIIQLSQKHHKHHRVLT